MSYIPRTCPFCGLALDPGEKCTCDTAPDISIESPKDREFPPQMFAKHKCDWCGANIIGKSYDISGDKCCFRCNLAFQNLKKQREELKKYDRSLLRQMRI